MTARALPTGRPYVYPRLPSPTHTRLLELKPSEDSSTELRCRIHVVDLYDPEIALYEAISYTWAADVFSHVLWIDGDAGGPNRLPITANLSDALYRFRRRIKSRFLWADAICINQNDAPEKSTHIPLMTGIYRGAERVLVWLGGGQAEERKLSRINVLGRLMYLQAGVCSDSDRRELSDSVLDLLLLPWFSRRWIIQEVVLSPNVVIFCGAQQSSFLRLVQVVLGLPPSLWKSSEHATGLIAMFDLWKWWALKQAEEGTRGLLRLLWDFDHFGCADGRDRIYTLAALAEDVRVHKAPQELPPRSLGWNREIVVDYRTSVEEVYVSTAQMILNSGHLQYCLSQASARFGAVGTAGLPSWVPDWRNSIKCLQFWDDVHATPLLGKSKSHRNIWRLANNDAYLLRAEFSCVRNYRPTIPDQYVDKWDVYSDLDKVANTVPAPFSNLMTLPEDSWVYDLAYASEENAIAPMVITWKGESFPDLENGLNVSMWVTSTFSTIWERVLLSLAEAEIIPGFAVLRQRAWDLCVDRFTHVITAGGKFFDHLDLEQQQNLSRFCDSSKDDHGRPSKYTPLPGESGDVDLMQEARGSPGRLDVWKMSSIVRDIVLGTAQESSMLKALLVLIAITMNGRCLFTCEVDWKPAHALAADIMGIGATRLQEGDRILSFPSYKRLWATTMVVREVKLDFAKIKDALGEITREHGRCKMQEYPPPVYEFVGECFLTTTRWVSPMRGLHRRRWSIETEVNTYDYSTYDDQVVGQLDNIVSESCDYDVIFL